MHGRARGMTKDKNGAVIKTDFNPALSRAPTERTLEGRAISTLRVGANTRTHTEERAAPGCPHLRTEVERDVEAGVVGAVQSVGGAVAVESVPTGDVELTPIGHRRARAEHRTEGIAAVAIRPIAGTRRVLGGA